MRRTLANIFGVFGYTSLLLQWMWLAVLLVTPLMENGVLQSAFLPEKTTRPSVTSSVELPEPLAIVFMGLAVAFAIAVTIYALATVPRTIGKVGKNATIKSAKAILPHVTHHKVLSKKRQKSLLERITWAVKLCLVGLPPLLLLIPPHASLGLSHSITLSVGLFCAILSALWFGLQFMIVRLAKIDPRYIW